MKKQTDMYQGGKNVGWWAGVFRGYPTEPNHVDPAIAGDPDWCRGYRDGNAAYFESLKKNG